MFSYHQLRSLSLFHLVRPLLQEATTDPISMMGIMCTNQESGGKHILIWTFCKIKFFAEVSTKYNIALKSFNSALIYHTEKEQLI